jgi:Cysteine synthase
LGIRRTRRALFKTKGKLFGACGQHTFGKDKKVLEAFDINPNVKIYAKLESTNPGGSVKDRAALSMFLNAIKKVLYKKIRL